MNKKQNLDKKIRDKERKDLEVENQLLRQKLSLILTIVSDIVQHTDVNVELKDLNNKAVQEKMTVITTDDVIKRQRMNDFTFKKEDKEEKNNE